MSVLLMLMVLFSVGVSAHCVWPESPVRVDASQVFWIDVFYAHPDDPMENRDMTDLTLYVYFPDGQVVELSLEKMATYQQGNTSFTEAGEYVFVAERSPNRYRLQEIRDFGKSITWVGQQMDYTRGPVGLPLEVIPLGRNDVDQGNIELLVEVRYNGEAVRGAKSNCSDLFLWGAGSLRKSTKLYWMTMVGQLLFWIRATVMYWRRIT